MSNQWWKEAVIYQIYLKSFYDSNGDGVGDIGGVIKKLPYLKELGIDAIWLCPFYESPMKDNGYDISDYYKVNPLFGNMDDMDMLLRLAKDYNIKIIIDMVLNHTSDQHPWFKAALEDLNSVYRDYYIFKESDELPSNARSNFGGSVWEKIGDEYYFHAFDKSQPDLNWENEKMRHELYDMMNYWIDKGVNGFRMDAITFIKKNQEFISLDADGEDGLVDVGKTCLNQHGINEFLQEMKENTYSSDEFMTVAEAPGVPYEALGEYIGENGHFSMLFDFSYADIDITPGEAWYKEKNWTICELKEKLFYSQRSIQDVGWGAVYLENHDQPRSINKYFKATTLEHNKLFYMGSCLATMFMLLRGTPFIYQGQEIGMLNCYFDDIKDYDDINTYDQYNRAIEAGYTKEQALGVTYRRSRDNSRTPMQWDTSHNAGFTTAIPWIQVNDNYKQINVQNQMENEDSLFHYYRKLIELRKSYEYKQVLVDGRIKEIFKHNDNIVAYSRYINNRELIIIANMSMNIHKLTLEFKACVLCNYKQVHKEGNNDILVRPYEALVLEV